MNGLLVPTRILFQVGVQLELVSGQRQQVMLFVPVASFFVNNAAFTIFVFKRSIGPSAFKISIFPLHTGEIHRHFVFGRLPTLHITIVKNLIQKLDGTLTTNLCAHIQIICRDKVVSQVRHFGVNAFTCQVQADSQVFI